MIPTGSAINIPAEISGAIKTYGMDVSQNSWGSGPTTGCAFTAQNPEFSSYTNVGVAYDQVVRGLYNKKVVVVFSAGNQQQNCQGVINEPQGPR